MDWRNPFSWLTEKLRVKVEWAKYLFDLRIGFKRDGKWKIGYVGLWNPVTQNFWNAVMSCNVYILKTTLWNIPIIIPRVNLVIRFAHDYWFEAGIGYLFDRGEFGAKCVIMNWAHEEIYNPDCNAESWNEGNV